MLFCDITGFLENSREAVSSGIILDTSLRQCRSFACKVGDVFLEIFM
jgi:hypothetical protein